MTLVECEIVFFIGVFPLKEGFEPVLEKKIKPTGFTCIKTQNYLTTKN